MDPLSVSASIIAVLQIATSVSSFCMQYVRSAKNAKAELLRLVQELGGLQIVLTTLKQLTERRTEPSQNEGGLQVTASEDPYLLPTLRRLCDLEYVFQECLRKLKRLERDIAPQLDNSTSPLSKKEAIIRVLKWPIKEAYMKSIMDDINEYITLFSLALTLDETTAVLDIHGTTRATYSTVQSLKELQDNEKKRRLAHDVVQWLCAPDTSVDYADALQRRANNTGSWLICGNQYGQWKCNRDSLLWIYGTAGSGKTILSSTVVEDLMRHCESGPGIAVAYFYFKLDDVSKKNNTGMLRSLVKQLFERGNGESQALTKLFGKGNQQPTSGQLLSTLHDMMLEFTDTYIVLDALDECEERDDLFKAVEEMGSWKTANIHLLCTSRDEKDIKDSIEPIGMAHHHIKLSAAVTKDDIRTYIRERLRTDRALRRWRGHLKVQEEIEDSLTEKSDGMFQWVMCQLKALEKCLRPSQLRRALESLPETLYDTYAQMLSRISEENYELALAELAAVDFDGDPPVVERFWEPDEILKICPGLITTVEEHNESGDNEPRILVRLAHISVREYLLSNDIRRSQAARYQIKEAAAHTSITECCLLYMQLFEMPPPDAEKEYPLAIYTAENWLYHYDCVPESAERVHDLAVDFFLKRKKAYSNWLSFFCSEGFQPSPPRFHIDLRDSVSDSPLNVASAYGLLSVLKRMFTSSEVDTSSESALKGALRSAYLGRLPPRPNAEAIGLLLQHGAHFGGDPRFSHTLHGASYYGFDDVVKMQLERGFDVNTRGGDFGTALQAAAEGRKGPHNYHTSGRHGKPLEDIVPTTVKLLLENGADPNLCDRREWSPLLSSCAYGDIQCVKLLLDHGADPNFRLETGKGVLQRNCLSEACRSGDIRIVKLLLDRGADIRSPGTLTAATRASKIDIMRLFLEAGADPNVVDEGQSEPPLHMACSYCRPELVELLLEYGANPNMTAGQFATPLQIASIYWGSIDILKLLVGKGADVNYVGGRFGTALHCAIWFGDLEMVQYLIDSGADITLQGRPFPSVLRAALQNGHTDIFILLLKLGADFPIPGGPYGETFRETLASAPPTKTELNFQTGDENTRSLCVLRRKGASFTDFDNLVLDDHGNQYGAAAADIEWDCVLPKP